MSSFLCILFFIFGVLERVESLKIGYFIVSALFSIAMGLDGKGDGNG